MILRPARANDAAAICAIHNPLIRDTLVTFTTVERTEEAVAADIAARGVLFQVAEGGDGLLGFATCGTFRNGPGYAATMEHTVMLAPGARGQGVGRALMARLEDAARARGVHVLVGGISGANPAGLAFHARLGFTEAGRLPEVGCKQGQWLDLVLMQKILCRNAAPDTGAVAG